MSVMQHMQHHGANDLKAIPDIGAQGVVGQQPTTASDLVQLFTLDLAHCPRFDRTAEYTLARRTRSAWVQLIISLQARHEHLATLLGTHHLPSSYDTISESEILQLLHRIHGHVEQAKVRTASCDIASLQSWLAQVRENLARFRDCRDEMVRRNLRFVVMLARRCHHQGASFLDLVQEGALGMMRAVEKFDPDRGVRFASYAVWWIREGFARALASREDTICFSPTPSREEDEDSPLDDIATPNESSPEMIVLNADMARGLHRALACLPVQEAEIVRLRFGLGTGRTHTLEQVSQRLDLSRAQVQLREQRALARLRALLQRPTAVTPPCTQQPQQHWRKAA
jgi:RNA polymerase nonessential primary-like sigma factor